MKSAHLNCPLNMEEENVVAQTSEEQAEEVVEESQEETTEENPELTKAQQIAENQRIRAEKAEKELKKLKENKTVNSQEPVQHSTADIIALSKVHEDDVERVERFAKSEGISVREALKNDELKAILSLREEQRTTASAANVSTTRRSSAKITDEVLVSKASKGELPDDDEGIARLVAAKAKSK